MTARTGINISHSALMTEEGCPLRGYLTARRGIGEVEEDTKSRRGSLGHAFLADRVKQLGAMPNRKGADPSEWPDDLRVQEFPEVPRG